MTDRVRALASTRLCCRALIVLLFLLSRISLALPSFSDVKSGYVSSEATLLDRNGEVLQQLRADLKHRRLEWTALDAISPALRAMVVLAEDRRFESHRGVDWLALARASAGNLLGHRASGASTITMQLVALLDPKLKPRRSHRGLWQKLTQIREARELELHWTKPQILEAYLNLVTYRGELQGIAAAAQGFWHKAPQGLDIDESAMLTALLRGPNATPAEVSARACELKRKREPGTGCDALEKLTHQTLSHPYSVLPRAQLAAAVARQLIPAGKAAARSINVRSTLDARTQRFAIETLRRQVLAYRDRNVNDAAALVLDNRTGDVLAYVDNLGKLGSSGVDGVKARRQAGSTLKPFLYALAIDSRVLTASSLIEDSDTEIQVGGGLYRPTNYDHEFHGLVPARVALASSLNVPAVRVLELVGVEAFVEKLSQLGFSGLKRADYYGPSLALGSADVSLWDLTNAYRALANHGRSSVAHLTSGTGGSGAEPSRRKPLSRRVYSPETAFVIADVLSDRESRNLTFGLENSLVTHSWSAVKTGTSKDMRDNWCVGFSDRYTVGVWVGNFSGAPMWNVSGITGAAPAWVDIMNWLHARHSSQPPVTPHGLVRVRLAGEDRAAWFLKGTEPHLGKLIPVTARQRIVAPAPDTIIALDPDIPRDRQRVFFEASESAPRLFWELNGKRMGSADRNLEWTPERPGKYALSLVDQQGEAIDEVKFSVRGSWGTDSD